MPETYRETTATAEAILATDRPLSFGGTVGLVDYMGGDARIASAATLGHGPHIAGLQSEQDLLVSLAHNNIWAPYAFAEIKLKFSTDLAAAEHIMYQSSISGNQQSGRYTPFKAETSDLTMLGASPELQDAHRAAAERVFAIYDELMGPEIGLAKELARGVTPDTTTTNYFAKLNLAQLFGVVENLERHSWKQNEERQALADELLGIASAVAPLAVDAYRASRAGETKDFVDWGRVADAAHVAVMYQGRYRTGRKQETQRVVVDELESLLDSPSEPIPGGMLVLTDYMGDFRALANAARVSYKNSGTFSKDEALVSTLIRDQHTSPIEMAELAFRMRVPSYISRQLRRHRTLDEAEFMGSQAFAEKRYMPDTSTLAPQSRTNQQGREGSYDDATRTRILDLFIGSGTAYRAIELQSDDPTLRDRLGPVDRWTAFSVKGDTHNWRHFLNLRADPHAQQEAQQYARQIGVVMRAHVPLVMAANDRFFVNATRFEPRELDVLENAGGKDATLTDLVLTAVDERIFGKSLSPRNLAKIDEFVSRVQRLGIALE